MRKISMDRGVPALPGSLASTATSGSGIGVEVGERVTISRPRVGCYGDEELADALPVDIGSGVGVPECFSGAGEDAGQSESVIVVRDSSGDGETTCRGVGVEVDERDEGPGQLVAGAAEVAGLDVEEAEVGRYRPSHGTVGWHTD